MGWSCVDYCYLFISCLESHSDGTHSLQRIHWWAMMQCYIFPNLHWWRSKLGWPKCKYSFFVVEILDIRLMWTWMNDAFIELYCVLLYTQSALQLCGGGGGGLSSTSTSQCIRVHCYDPSIALECWLNSLMILANILCKQPDLKGICKSCFQ